MTLMDLGISVRLFEDPDIPFSFRMGNFILLLVLVFFWAFGFLFDNKGFF